VLSPMRKPPGEAELAPEPTQARDQSPDPVIAGAAAQEALDFLRLQSSVQWLRRECATLEAKTVHLAARRQDRRQRLPRARQLAPIPGLAELTADLRRKAPLQAAARIDLTPPGARDRLMTPPPRRQQALTVRGAIYILLAALIAGSIAYHVASDGGLLAALSPALAAPGGG
jgi:hypothetical protein